MFTVCAGLLHLVCVLAMAAKTEAEKLWHSRLIHADLESIRQLSGRDLVTGLDLRDAKRSTQDCEGCIKENQYKSVMRSKPFRATKTGEVIHSDVCGPISVDSIGGSRYFVTFIDEFSGFITVVTIAKRSEVVDNFKRYHRWLERKYDCRIKTLHCDGGGEYISLME